MAMREKVAIAGLRGYLRMVKVEEEGGRKVNRPRQDGEEERRYRRLAGKSSWFQGSRGGAKMKRPQMGRRRPTRRGNVKEKEIDTVMFIVHTPGDFLAKSLQKAEDKFVEKKPGGKVKMVSRGGSALQDILCNKNPWQKEGCGRQDCFICGSGNPGGCQKEGSVYSITCQECKSRGILASYWGEASRSGYLRGLDHQSLLKRKDDSSPLWKHSAEHHEGREDVVYSMKVERSYAESPLNRQIDESTSIARSRAQIPMNSRSEWNSQRIPRIVLQVQGKDQLEDDEKMPSMETWTVQAPTVKVNINQERRKERPSEEGDEGQTKKRRVGDSTDLPGEGAAALGSATVKNSLQFRQEEVEEDRERPPLGEGDREEQRPRAVFPLPMRSPKAKAIKKPSKGKIKNELRNKITNYFQLQDVKTSQELESRNSLSLSESADQSVVAGVGPKSEADSSSE